MADDTLALPVMDDLRACLCAQLEESPGGPTCFCSLYPGQTVSWDFCGCKAGAGGGCGQAWVRLDRIFPSLQFPQQDTSAQSCASGLAAVLELGVGRCMPTPDARGNAPGAAEQTEAVRIQLGDWRAMREAVKCCPALADRDMVMGAYTPVSRGGCGGGTLQVTVRLGRLR